MAGTDHHYSCATPAASTASSTDPSSQKNQAANRVLQALCVFEHLSNPEVLKSVQLYSENGSMSAIQQELTFSPNGYAQISEPIPSYFSKYSAIDSEDFFTTLKKINEIDLWTCIFEYHKHRVPASIPHLLSVSNNPLLQSLPCLAYDLMLVEKDIQCRACDLSHVLVPPPRLELDRSQLHGDQSRPANSQLSPQGRALQSPTKWSLSAVSALTGQSEHTDEDFQRETLLSPGGNDAFSQQESEADELGGPEHGMEMHQVETNLHEWGSDLELASPRIFHPCQLGSSWSTSTMSGVPFPGGLSGLSPTALSPTSSMVSNQKGAGLDPNCSSWNSSLFITNGNISGSDGYPLDPSSSFSTQSSLDPLKPLNTNSEFSNAPVGPGSLLEPSVSSILGQKQMRHLNPPAGHLERLVERCPSHCSDESVGTPLSALRIGQAETLNPVGLSLQPLGTSLGGDKEGFMYRDLGLAGYSLEGATGCPAPRNFPGLQQEDFSGCARLSGGQAEEFGGGRLEVFTGGQIDNFAGCQSEPFSGFQTEGLYAPRADTFPGGHADIFWNENFLRDCRNEGLILRDTGRNEAAYMQDGRLCPEEPLLRCTSRNDGLLLRDDGFALDSTRSREVNYLNRTPDIGYYMKDPTVDNNISTKNMLQKVSGSAQGHSHQRGPSERMTEITLAELSHYFNMPITQASKELKVGLTVLKKRCREFGIPRWPHRKMKSLDSLIHNIQELAKGPEGQTSVPVQNAVRELECQKKRMEERPGIELAERTKRLRQACFKASYKKRRQAQIEGAPSQSGPSRQSKSSSPCYDKVSSSNGARSGSVDQCISATMVS